MTPRTIEREGGLRVLRSEDVVVISLMTAGTLQRGTCVVSVGMTLAACDCRVSTGQGELRFRMIERSRLPGSGCVACLAISRDPRRDMIRIGGGIELLLVAADAGHRCPRVDPVDVT